MEWKQGGETLIVLGTLFVLVVCAVMVMFIINHKRRLYGKQMLIDLYENKFAERLAKLELENKEMKREIARIKGVEYIEEPEDEFEDDDEDEDWEEDED